uniref:NADH dehydrogenase subunit 6 n=1 Tax=Scaphoideus nigrivalveus TaxID=2021108 RepID=A0A343ETC8_9HEMI|nr:NADH dehydrogenase subunit 6 [Scaphoideus nigrivalveus]
MKMMVIKLMMLMVSYIPFMKTPMSMGILLLIQTTMATILITKIMTSSWMAMIIFLMLIGGLLILFMYMSSIASNEKFSPNMFMIFPFITMIFPLEDMMSDTQMNEKLFSFTMNESITLMKIYNKKTIMITVMMFMYLLLAMISVTKIIKIHMGPLRSK